MIDWKEDDSELARFGRFNQSWDIAKELKCEGERASVVSAEKKNEFTMVWNGKFYDAQVDFIDLLNDYNKWSKAHYNR